MMQWLKLAIDLGLISNLSHIEVFENSIASFSA